ncbi:hypothetical protein F5Y19DRAFT_489347 [Xylariaceae sp. FL1651]|nr:hypothetical protein F5Y19DRAFT_489347 [Xylariaceae sp. FL1651]
MHTTSFVVFLAVAAVRAVSGESAHPPLLSTRELIPSCTTPLVRREWRALSNPERLGFIHAVKCLQKKPGKTSSSYAGVKSRYDDFLALHISQTDYIHWVGQFLPWHRFYLWLFEKELRSTCGYPGTVPYWDWTIDAVSEAEFLKAPVFDQWSGFGGNGPYIADISDFPDDWKTMVDIPGRTGGGCVRDGPFAQVPISMGPGNHTEYTPHCLRRDFSPWLATQTLNTSILESVMDASSYFELDLRIQGVALGVHFMSLHAGGHLGVGGMIGDVANVYSSPDWASRKMDIGGPDTQWAYPYNYFGDKPYKNITLDFTMNFGLIGGTVKVGSVMDTQSGLFCYIYM